LVALGIVIHFDSPLAVLALLLLSVDFPPLLSAFFGALAL
jgi:hypothetical protein